MQGLVQNARGQRGQGGKRENAPLTRPPSISRFMHQGTGGIFYPLPNASWFGVSDIGGGWVSEGFHPFPPDLWDWKGMSIRSRLVLAFGQNAINFALAYFLICIKTLVHQSIRTLLCTAVAFGHRCNQSCTEYIITRRYA